MCEKAPLSTINQGGNMSPASRTELLVRDLELARRLMSANQSRPFWYERQLTTEAKKVTASADLTTTQNSESSI